MEMNEGISAALVEAVDVDDRDAGPVCRSRLIAFGDERPRYAEPR
jgi:hypothetical protein